MLMGRVFINGQSFQAGGRVPEGSAVMNIF